MKKAVFILIILLAAQIALAEIPEAAKGKQCLVASEPSGVLFSCENPPAGAIGKNCVVCNNPSDTRGCPLQKRGVQFICQARSINPPPAALPTCIYDDTYAEINGQKDPKSATNYPCKNPINTNYVLLESLPNPFDQSNPLKEINVTGPNALGQYLNIIIRLAIGIAAVLAVVLIVMGGIQYMTTELVSGKEDGKRRITNAVLGLLVALGAYLILFTINPDLLKTELVIPETIIAYEGSPESSEAFKDLRTVNAAALQSLGITCDPGTTIQYIANSFVGKSTYSQPNRNKVTDTTAYFDCSSYVNQVYACKGWPSPGNVTAQIFNGAEQINTIEGTKINGVELRVGDLVGWKPGDRPGGEGHVLMYYGGGKLIDSRGSTPPNQAIQISNLSDWVSKIKYVKRSGR